MSFLLDTDTLSNIVRPSPPPELMRRLATIPRELQFTSSITVGELVYGAQRREPDIARRLLEAIDSRLLANLAILSFDAATARIYGTIRAELERRGVAIGDADTRIAAVALHHNLTVVTGNTRHFERVPGLTVDNWIS